MPRIFWTPKRKTLLLKQSKTMTVNQLAKKHLKSVVEIEKMLRQLSPNNPLIKKIRYENKIKITEYYPGYADNFLFQRMGSRSLIY